MSSFNCCFLICIQFQCKYKWTAKAVITVKMFWFFKAKSLRSTVLVFYASLGWAGLQWFNQTLFQMWPWRYFVDVVHIHHENFSGAEHSQHCGHLIQSVKGHKTKTWGFLEEEEILPQDSRVSSCLKFQPVGLPFWFYIHPARSHNLMSQFIGISLLIHKNNYKVQYK